MDEPILPTTPNILRVTHLFDVVISRFLEARNNLRDIGRYEADVESINLMNLIVRNVEGVIVIARSDLILLPSAITLARTAFDIAVRLRWMLDPKDPFEREVRWLAQLKSEEEYHERVAKRLDQIGADNQKPLKTFEQIREFRKNVEALLPKGYTPLTKLPNLDAMLKSMNEDRKYLAYIVLSQFPHGSHMATGLYRKNLGTMKELGEFISPSDWNMPLSTCWYSLFAAGCRLLKRLGGDAKYIPDELGAEVQEAINAVENH